MMKIFTGQKVIDVVYGDYVVACHICGNPIGLATAHPHQEIGLAWMDKFIGKKGKYVHKDCLSEKRKKKIQT